MKKLFNTNLNHGTLNLMLLILRVAIAAFMLSHGLSKLEILTGGGPIKFGDPIGIGEMASLLLAIFAEVVCSVLVLLGLFTRLAVIPLIITMLIAIFVIHAPDAFEVKELAYHYLLVYVFLLFAGAGKYSADHTISGKLNRRRR